MSLGWTVACSEDTSPDHWQENILAISEVINEMAAEQGSPRKREDTGRTDRGVHTAAPCFPIRPANPVIETTPISP